MHKVNNLKVGCKIGTEKFSVDVELQIPDSLKDCMTLARDSEEFAVQMFTRGWRIWNQEQSGARDLVQASTVEQRKPENVSKLRAAVQKVINEADPTAPPKRSGRPASPKEVSVTPELQQAMKKGDTSKLQELLAAQGVKVNFA